MKFGDLIYIAPPYSYKNSKGKAKGFNEDYPKPSGHSNFLYIYFLFSYYIGIVPYRFRFDSTQASYRIHSWLPQKMLCAVIHTLVLLRYALEVRRLYQTLNPTDPISFFRLIESSASFMCKLIAFHHFWKKRGVFFRIIKFLDTPKFYEYNPCKIQSFLLLSLICSSFLLVGIIRLFFDSQIVETSVWDLEQWYRHLLAETRYSYFLSRDPNKSLIPQLENISFLETFLAVITVISIQFRLFVGFYLDLCILFSVLSLWTPVSGYALAVNSSIEIELSRGTCKLSANTANTFRRMRIDENIVVWHFKALKHLSILISDAIGAFLLPAMVEIVFGYAIDFEGVLVSYDIMQKFTITLFYVCTCTTIYLSAEICKKMSCTKNWLDMKEQDLRISQNELTIILDDIAHDEVCINAAKTFTLNYAYVGAMVTLLVTFFIIRLQSETMSSPTPTSSGVDKEKL